MAKTVADGLWEMLYAAGVRRCYGIVGDALNPTIDALRRQGSIKSVHVRHEEFGVFAAVADSCLTGHPAAECGTSAVSAAVAERGLGVITVPRDVRRVRIFPTERRRSGCLAPNLHQRSRMTSEN